MKKVLISLLLTITALLGTAQIANAENISDTNNIQAQIEINKIETIKNKKNVETKWDYKNGQYYFYINGDLATGFWEIDDIIYFFDRNSGVMHSTGWFLDYDMWFYSYPSGELKEGWHYENSNYYYFRSEWGAPAMLVHESDYLENSDSSIGYYYFNLEGKMHTGWLQVRGNYYYYGEDGAALEQGWLFDDNSWYYINSHGRMSTNIEEIDGLFYEFDLNGRMKTGWSLIEKSNIGDKVWVYYGNNGVRYQNKWLLENNSWYYFDENGYMVTSRMDINGLWYDFDLNGVMK